MNEWISVTDAARIAGCSGTTVRGRMSVKSGTARRHPTPGGRGFRWQVRRSWAQELVVGKSESKARKRIDQAIVSRDKWRAESTRQKNQIEGLKARIERQRKEIEGLKTQLAAAEHERDGGIVLFNSLREQLQAAKKDRDEAVASRNNWAQRRCGTPPTIIDRLVAAVDSAPLQTLTQIDKPRHAALRRVVSLWSAVDHALVMFTQPGDSAQTTNDDDEVT